MTRSNSTPPNAPAKLWGGRFEGNTDAFVEAFTASVTFDQRMYRQDIRGSVAHATMLMRVGVLSEADHSLILEGLESIQQAIAAGEFEWSISREDVHMNIEAALIERIGDAGKRLHTGRSRNDQVATDIRLYVRDACDEIAAEQKRLLRGLIGLASEHSNTIMPGFTHLQTAQPVTFGHHVMAWFEMLLRDLERLQEVRNRLNRMPLGSAALAGTSYPIDRTITMELLEFDAIAENSLDAVSDRDFAIDFTAATAIALMHLSRIAEEMVLWMSAQFQFVDLPDAFCTGSSIMPQKKNPDVAELVRGKTGRANGNLIALLTLMKGQPLTYNKDNQEDKEPLFDSIDTWMYSARAFADMLPAMQVNHAAMREAAIKGFSTATDLADWLVKQGMAFRDAHEVVGQAVKYGVDNQIDLGDMPLETLQEFSDKIDASVFEVLTLEGSVNSRDHIGGTAPAQVRQAIARAPARLDAIYPSVS